jgi:hypothetical protein
MIPLGQITGEVRDVREWTSQIGSTAPTISNTKAMTGEYSVRFAANTASIGLSFPSQSGLRCGTWLNHAMPSGSFTAHLFRLRIGVTEIVRVQWVGNGNLQLLINGSVVAEISPQATAISQTNTWIALGLSYIANETVTFYVNGLAQLRYAAPNTPINEAYIGGGVWGNYAYFDDFYVDGNISVDEAPPPDRFLFKLVNDVGASSQWTPVGASNNYQCVNDAVPNNDTNYVVANTANLTDLYKTTNVTLPTDYKVSAVLPIALARAMAAGPTLRFVASDGSNTTIRNERAPGMAYTYLWESLSQAPDGGEWTESKINATQFGYRSAGIFS